MFIIPWFCTDGSLLWISDGLLNLHLSIAIMLSLFELFLVHLIGDYHTIILKSILTVALSLHNNMFSCNHLLSKFSILFQTYHVHWAFNICHELSLFWNLDQYVCPWVLEQAAFPFPLSGHLIVLNLPPSIASYSSIYFQEAVLSPHLWNCDSAREIVLGSMGTFTPGLSLSSKSPPREMKLLGNLLWHKFEPEQLDQQLMKPMSQAPWSSATWSSLHSSCWTWGYLVIHSMIFIVVTVFVLW